MRSFLLSIVAGAFVALAAVASSVASFALENPSAAALAYGAVFAGALVMIVVAGGELFTGNALIAIAVMNKQVSIRRFLLNLALVLCGNYLGGLLIALLVDQAAVPGKAGGGLAVALMVRGFGKMQTEFGVAFFSGILCNILVSVAVWSSYGAKDIAGKVAGIFFPIMLFATAGYDHVVANCYFLPAAKLAAQHPGWAELTTSVATGLNDLSWWAQLNNIIPVALGNLVGGLLIALVYELSYRNVETASGSRHS